jgi:hypothetical protein
LYSDLGVFYSGYCWHLYTDAELAAKVAPAQLQRLDRAAAGAKKSYFYASVGCCIQIFY